MYRRILASRSGPQRRILLSLVQHRYKSTYEERYAEKIKQRLEQLGMKDVAEFKSRSQGIKQEKLPLAPALQTKVPKTSQTPKSSASRHDGSPVTPLSDIMDLSRLLQTPHSAEQVGALWNAYHSKKSSEGKGFLSAVIPRPTYESFLPNAKKYPSFILPLPRPEAQIESPIEGSGLNIPYEFYFMEWSHWPSPPIPRFDGEALFTQPKDDVPSPNPPCTTVIFTPLQEYKLRQAYALPHLVLTHYTDLAHSHDIVLMRGELTPSSSGNQQFLLSPSAAQLLAFGLQRFYLPGRDARPGKLLSRFHERPEEFSWEELISIVQI